MGGLESRQAANDSLRSIPAMDELLNSPWAEELSAGLGREQVKKIITEVCDGIRRDVRGGANIEAPVRELAERRAQELIRLRASSSLKPVVNATGVVIHTNLGRSPLGREALQAVNDIAGRYNTLEYSVQEGVRGNRNSHIEWLIRDITGAQAALVVNNNAAAVLLALSAIAAGREVIVSNGELVEIGDSFRIPEILSFSGASMVAVGCTNSTRISDYSNAITEKTAILLKVHPSNYKIDGFTTEVNRRDLAELAASRGLVFMEDLGSGLLAALDKPFAHLEYSVKDCLEAGVNIISFSGDKLLGGPQLGVIAGSKQLIEKMQSHQLYRALRVDKMTLAAFEAVLRLYLSGRHKEIPVIKMIEADEKILLKKAQRLLRIIKQKTQSLAMDDLAVSVVKTNDAVGGGAYPTERMPGFGVSLHSASRSAESLAASFRMSSFPVIPGIQDGQIILHVRTLLDGDEKIIASSLEEWGARGG